jgi:hypothetical protein
MTEKELIELKKKIEKSKELVLKLTGERDALLKQLKKDWNCNSVAEAKQLLKKMEKDADKKETSIEKEKENLEKELEKIETDE